MLIKPRIKIKPQLKGPLDISRELWREYEFGGTIYRISNPVSLYVGQTTHRIVDEDGIVHCVPSVGVNGCVLRWKNKDIKVPVNF